MLRGDAEAVLRMPWCFMLASEPVANEPSPRVFSEPTEAMFSEPQKLRVTRRVDRVLYGPRRYEPGQEFVADARAVERLVEEGACEVAE